jgi:hypothetical protein
VPRPGRICRLAYGHARFRCNDWTEAAANLKGKSNAEAAALIKSKHPSVKASDEDLQVMNQWMQSGFPRAAGM